MNLAPAPQVVTFGHAIVDVFFHAAEGFLGEHSLVKGSMELIDEERAVSLNAAMTATAGAELMVQSGGSAANTAVVSAVLGAPTAFVGKVREDELGHAFADDLHTVGVHYATSYETEPGPPTGRCLVTVTPDAERTMCTFLGAARGIRRNDVDAELLANAAVTYVEGYLWDEQRAHDALFHAIGIVKAAGKKFSVTLSDSFLVDRFRSEFLDLIPKSVDILFCNDAELCSLFQTDNLGTALEKIAPMCEIAAVTVGANGSLVVSGGTTIEVPTGVVERVVDTTGAGDAYAGGFLYGFSQGLALRRCAEIGNLAAGDVISRTGARPSSALRSLVHG